MHSLGYIVICACVGTQFFTVVLSVTICSRGSSESHRPEQ